MTISIITKYTYSISIKLLLTISNVFCLENNYGYHLY